MNQITENAAQLLENVRKTVPLVHNITNYVTVNDAANAVLAIGASPIMADDIEEAADITAISNALVLNMGTLNKRTVESMLAAGKRANELGVPVVFDPVGAGASVFRNETAQKITGQVTLSVIRATCRSFPLSRVSALRQKAWTAHGRTKRTTPYRLRKRPRRSSNALPRSQGRLM